MGHVALAGVAIGVLTGAAPVWTALVAAVARRGGDRADPGPRPHQRRRRAGRDVLRRHRRRRRADLARRRRARRPTSTPTCSARSPPPATPTCVTFAVLAGVVLVVTLRLLAPRCSRSATTRSTPAPSGLPVLALNLLLAVLTAVTVVVSMRVVGLLLISALMVLPNAIAQLVCHSFRSTLLLAVATGVVVSLAGVSCQLLRRHPLGRHDRAVRHRAVRPDRARDGGAATRWPGAGTRPPRCTTRTSTARTAGTRPCRTTTTSTTCTRATGTPSTPATTTSTETT